jgi:GT2 family glycosyltransferase
MTLSETQITVSIIIPTWQHRDLVLRLLDLLEAQTRPPDEVIIIDNGSTDGTADAVAGRATVIRLTENAGFARAVNLGITSAHGQWVGIVNNDVEPRHDWLELLLKSRQDFVTGKSLNYNQPAILDGTYDVLSRVAMPWRAGSGRRNQQIFDENSICQFTSWTAVLFRRQVFERIGLLDEAFGSYYEDVDFGLRCARNGISGEYEPRAVALHRGSATLGAWRPGTVRLLTRNHRLLILKHFGSEMDRTTKCRLFLSRVLWAMLAARHGQMRAWWAGVREPLPTVSGPPADPGSLKKILEESESELYRLQKETGFDWYWRVYFSLFPPR